MSPPPSPQPHPQQQQVLIVDDDPIIIQSLSQAMAPLARVCFATDGETALALARANPPDLILLDAEMPGRNGFEVCAELKLDDSLAAVPVMFVTSHAEPDFEASGFEAGAADFVTKPVDPELLVLRARAHLRAKAAADQLRTISATDALTGVGNRRAFDEALQREWQRCQRSGVPLALLLVDVDHFKRFNDSHGHPAGDACLQRVAQALHQACRRPADHVFRCGGEEFALLLPATDEIGAHHCANRAMAAVTRMRIAHGDSPVSEHLTISVGIAWHDAADPMWSQAGADGRGQAGADALVRPEHLVAVADQVLYLAKQRGRSRSCATALTPLAVACLRPAMTRTPPPAEA